MSVGLQVIIAGCLALVSIAVAVIASAAHAALSAKADELTARSAQILKHAGLLDADLPGRPKP